jgi:hypothetical protein
MEILSKFFFGGGGGQGITTHWKRCPISGAKQGIQKLEICQKDNKIK